MIAPRSADEQYLKRAREPMRATAASTTVPSMFARMAQDLGNARFTRVIASAPTLARQDSDSEDEGEKPKKKDTRGRKEAPTKRGGHRGEGKLPVEVQSGRNREVFHNIKKKNKGALAEALGTRGEITPAFNVQRGSGRALGVLVEKTKTAQMDRSQVLKEARPLAAKVKKGTYTADDAAGLVALVDVLVRQGNTEPLSMFGFKPKEWAKVVERAKEAEQEDETEELDVPSSTPDSTTTRRDNDDDDTGGGGTPIEVM